MHAKRAKNAVRVHICPYTVDKYVYIIVYIYGIYYSMCVVYRIYTCIGID